MYRSQEIYASPMEGECMPVADPDVLEQGLKKIADNSIAVSGDGFGVSPVGGESIARVAMRASDGIYLNLHPQAMTISAQTTDALETLMTEWFSHYPKEPTFARAAHGVPMMLTRFDGTITPDGEIGVCEFDDVPTGFNALRSINPVAASYVDGMVAELGADLHSAFLPEPDYVYPHDDDSWLPLANDVVIDSGVAVIPRARRTASGFDPFMDRWGEQSIVGAWERDNKGPLIPMNLGVLAANLATALEVGSRVKGEQPVFMKALKSSRTEAAGVMATNKFGIRGAATAKQLTN